MDFIVVCGANTDCFELLNDALDKVDEHMQEGKTPTFIDLSQGKTYFYTSLDVEPTVLPIFMHSLSWDEEDD